MKIIDGAFGIQVFEKGKNFRRSSWPQGDFICMDGAEGGTIWYYSEKDDDMLPGYTLGIHDLGADDWEILG